jgi:hypothetical protein
MVFVALAAVGFAIGINTAALAFLATPWIWVTTLAIHLYRRAAESSIRMAPSLGTSSHPTASPGRW